MIKAVITDLDNTLYDWIGFYVPSFLAMIKRLGQLTAINEEELKASFQRLHQKYRTSEYTFSIQQLDVLRKDTEGLTTKEILAKYDDAIREFRRVRKERLRLYDSVADTLTMIRAQGKMVVAVTDALMFHAVVTRLRLLGVEHLFDGVFAPPDHGFPPGTTPEDVRFYREAGRYETSIPITVELDTSLRKPSPEILRLVLARIGVRADEAVYVGDSVARDIAMAQHCRVHDVLARYGARDASSLYGELLKITYMTPEEVERQDGAQAHLEPSWAIDSFGELLRVVEALDCGSAHRSVSPERDKHPTVGRD